MNKPLSPEHKAEVDHLYQILGEHYELQALTQNEVTVYSWVKMIESGQCTVEEAFIGIIVTLAKEKKKYFDELIKERVENGTHIPKIFNPIEE